MYRFQEECFSGNTRLVWSRLLGDLADLSEILLSLIFVFPFHWKHNWTVRLDTIYVIFQILSFHMVYM